MMRNIHAYISQSLLTLCEAQKLREFLHNEIINNYKYIPYTSSKNILFNHVGKIDIYGDNTQAMNVEHIFPQHYFKNDTNKLMMKSDLHNLYLCNSKLNSYRQNFKYVDSSHANKYDNIKILDMKGNVVTKPDEIFSKCGYLMISNRKNKVFVPSPYSRGKISRALSYFAIKYNYTEILNNIIDIKTLLEWNIKDPVDDDEYLKNIIIYKYQGNLNPFIIDPDLMMYSFSDKATIGDELLSKKRYSCINPMYTIDYLIDEVKRLEINDKEYQSIIKKLSKLNRL
jgi:endonuclease I